MLKKGFFDFLWIGPICSWCLSYFCRQRWAIPRPSMTDKTCHFFPHHFRRRVENNGLCFSARAPGEKLKILSVPAFPPLFFLRCSFGGRLHICFYVGIWWAYVSPLQVLHFLRLCLARTWTSRASYVGGHLLTAVYRKPFPRLNLSPTRFLILLSNERIDPHPPW